MWIKLCALKETDRQREERQKDRLRLIPVLLIDSCISGWAGFIFYKTSKYPHFLCLFLFKRYKNKHFWVPWTQNPVKEWVELVSWGCGKFNHICVYLSSIIHKVCSPHNVQKHYFCYKGTIFLKLQCCDTCGRSGTLKR